VTGKVLGKNVFQEMSMSNIRSLLENMKDENIKTPVQINLSLTEIQHYLQKERDPKLIFQWAKIYIEKTLNI